MHYKNIINKNNFKKELIRLQMISKTMIFLIHRILNNKI